MKKIFYYISIVLLLAIGNSCNEEEFLNVTPQAADNSAAFYKNMLHANQALTACYSQFNSLGAWDKDLIMTFGEIASDDAEAGGAHVNEVEAAELVNRLQYRPIDGYFSNVWGTFYRAISLANIAITKLPAIADTDPDVDMDLLNKRIAEAKFIRAINYFYLTIVFGEVPLVDRELGASEYLMGRSPLRDVYNLIEKDLKEAIDVLPERGGWGEEVGRATKGAAQALLARLYLYESSFAKHYAGSDPRYTGLTERWAEALQYAETVINSGKYYLVGIDGETYETWRSPETNGFRYIFTSEGDHSPETVFEITCVQEGLGYDDARGQSLANWTSARMYIDDKGADKSTTYWGLGLPSPHLKDAFDDGDPRLRASIVWEGCTDCEPIQIQGGGNFAVSFAESVTKTYQRKWENSAAEFKDRGGDWDSAPSNVKLIRFSDVYLIAAEAALMSGNNGKALEYINKVRERARNCGTSGQPAALTSVTLDDIIHERRLEFAGEGHRRFDIVRWNKAYELLNTPTWDGTPRTFNRGEHDYQPIPQREIELSQGNLKQYTAY